MLHLNGSISTELLKIRFDVLATIINSEGVDLPTRKLLYIGFKNLEKNKDFLLELEKEDQTVSRKFTNEGNYIFSITQRNTREWILNKTMKKDRGFHRFTHI